MIFAFEYYAMFLLCIIAISLVLLYLLYSKIREKRTLWQRRGVPYHDESIWKFVQLFRTKSAAELFLYRHNQFPEERYHGVYLLMQPMLIIKDPELIKNITVKDFDHFVNRRQIVSPEVDALWGGNLVSLQGDKWHEVRNTLSPAFTGSKMRIIFGLLDEAAKQFVDHYKDKGSEFELEMKDVTSRFANDVIATTAFGLKVDSFQNPDNTFFLMGKDATNFSGLRLARFFLTAVSAPLAKFLRISMIPDYLSRYFTNIIVDTLKVREEQNITRVDMLHLMREAAKQRNTQNTDKEPITTQDIVAQAFIFFVAGFDTISSALGFVFYELALHPDIQARLYKEISAVEVDSLDYEKLKTMKYLDMVISETLRKWPPGLVMERVVNKPYTIEPTRTNEKPVHLEVGDIAIASIIGFHMDPNNFPEPEKFDPERFNPENKDTFHPYAYMPFGFGPRHCIGNRFALMEMKIFVYYFLKHFEVSPVARTRIPMVLTKNSFNLVPEGGMYLGIKPRN